MLALVKQDGTVAASTVMMPGKLLSVTDETAMRCPRP